MVHNLFYLAPKECRTYALPMEEGFESLATMDLESAGADFDSVVQISKNSTPDPSSSSNANTAPMEMLALPSQQPLSPLITDRLSHPRGPASPPLPSSHSGTPALSSPNTPLISPARSLPNAPPISPVYLRPNSPPLSLSLSHPNMPPISPAHSCLKSPLTGPTGACAMTPVTSQVDHSMLELTREGTPIPSEVVLVEIRLRSSGWSSKKRCNEDVEEVNQAPSKRMRSSKMNAALANVATPATKWAANRAPSTMLQSTKKITTRATHTLAESSSAIIPVQAKVNSPPWFSRMLVMLQSESRMGEEWMELVNLWVLFEARSQYEEVKKLDPTRRPAAVGLWIGRAHSSMWRPIITDVSKYVASFWEWWSVIQPDWRLEDGQLVHEHVVGDWEALRLPGINRVVSVVVALFYWGLEVLEDSHGQSHWVSAVEECHDVFKQFWLSLLHHVFS